ncbi:MAG TPA: hypothetical protein VH593_10645, partial [Ktedonobacteraceae bacterium]
MKSTSGKESVTVPNRWTEIVPAPGPVSGRVPVYKQRRSRINRILTRRRHLNRAYKKVASRIVHTITAFAALIATILSGGAGVAYAYYQSQLPLLNGIAQ